MAANFSNQITGLASVDAKLALLVGKERRRIVRKSLGAGMKEGRKAIREELNALPISSQLKRALRPAIASSFKRDPRINEHAARVGIGIGKRKPARRSGKNTGSGVGIGKRNSHWFLLGTKARFVKSASGRSAGHITAVPAVANAGRKSAGKMINTIRRTALTEIEATVKRLR